MRHNRRANDRATPDCAGHHNSSSKVYSRQKYLGDELKRRFPGQVLHVPVLVTKQDSIGRVETSQRTRTFLFAALATAVAHIFGRQRIRFYENGVVSLNLPIAGQVIGTQATRTTHPRVLHELSKFLTALFGEAMTVDNPFAWKTKTEVTALIAGAGHGDLIAHSVSCSHVHSMTKLHTHCGTCSQCLDRRFAVLAAGVERRDPTEMYRVDLLTGAREIGNERTMAEAYVRSALEFRRVTQEGFLIKFAGEISRGAFAFAGMTPDEVARSAFDLHRRHGNAVHAVLTAGVQGHAAELVSQTLPASCILRIAVSEHGREFDTNPIEPVITDGRARPQPDRRNFQHPSEIRLALDERASHICIRGLLPIKGKANYALIDLLTAQHRKDAAAEHAPANYSYTSAHELAKALSIELPTLRRRVTRFRKAVAVMFEERLGFPLGKDDLIETKEWHGYRINPRVRIIASSEIEIVRHGSRPKRHIL